MGIGCFQSKPLFFAVHKGLYSHAVFWYSNTPVTGIPMNPSVAGQIIATSHDQKPQTEEFPLRISPSFRMFQVGEILSIWPDQCIMKFDGQNPAPPRMIIIPSIYRVEKPSQVVQAFFHQQVSYGV